MRDENETFNRLDARHKVGGVLFCGDDYYDSFYLDVLQNCLRMKNLLTYSQLAFILNIEPIEAVRKIIFVHCKLGGLPTPPYYHIIKDYLGKDSPYPSEFDIDLLAKHLNIPDLRYAVNDIQENYMKRQGTKKYILCDFPEKELRTKLKSAVRIPPVLVSILKPEDVEIIQNEWNRRYGITFGLQTKKINKS